MTGKLIVQFKRRIDRLSISNRASQRNNIVKKTNYVSKCNIIDNYNIFLYFAQDIHLMTNVVTYDKNAISQ